MNIGHTNGLSLPGPEGSEDMPNCVGVVGRRPRPRSPIIWSGTSYPTRWGTRTSSRGRSPSTRRLSPIGNDPTRREPACRWISWFGILSDLCVTRYTRLAFGTATRLGRSTRKGSATTTGMMPPGWDMVKCEKMYRSSLMCNSIGDHLFTWMRHQIMFR